ncbi:MAG: HEPN domain-containing protein [Phenylobacterium sp.]|uniref:HEPN domain-containing protein n=1 Tax=Phenylobacterium sp. TaxID=1871053 RepID=UPI0027248109|nr:HEPN domain-containing protein [Phenylobacterium sp.]MDO8409121.1 HEPN domain-containing protein [Phenylobacterium sp.]
MSHLVTTGLGEFPDQIQWSLPLVAQGFQVLAGIQDVLERGQPGGNIGIAVGPGWSGDAGLPLALTCLRKARLLGTGPAVTWLRDLLTRRTFEVRGYARVLGVSPGDAGVSLAPNLEIRPLAQSGSVRVGRSDMLAKREAEAVQRSIGTPTVLVASLQQSPAITEGAAQPQPVHYDFWPIVNILGGLAASPATLAYVWWEAADPDLEACMMDAGVGWPMLDVDLAHRYQPAPMSAYAAQVVSCVVGSNGQFRRRLELAFERINQALKRQRPGDRALEAAIALEALLNDEKTELRYRYSLRAARLLGSDFSDRRAVRKAVRDLYDLRSKVVHGGDIASSAKNDAIAAEGIRVASEVARHLALAGGIPDWDAVELR